MSQFPLLGAGFIDPEISPMDRQEYHDRPTGEISGLACPALTAVAERRTVHLVMREHPAKKKTEYPDRTHGSVLAAKVRKLANRLTADERRAHLDAAIAKTYGGSDAAKTTLARRESGV